jgi:hypothetical protein
MSRTAFVFATLFVIGAFGTLLAAACGGFGAAGPPGGADAVDGALDGAMDGAPVGDASGIVGTYGLATAGDGKGYCDQTFGAISKTFLGPSCCNAADRASGQYVLLVGLLAGLTQECETSLEVSIAKGRLTYNGAAAASCFAELQALAGTACVGAVDVTLANQGASCHGVFAGNVPVSGACINDYECADGLTCVGYATPLPSTIAPLEGTCQNPPAIDQPCAQIKPDGSFGSTTMSFKFGTHPDCAPGAYCTAAAGGKCAAARTAGQSCFETSDCAAGLSCINDKCDAAGPADVGGACSVAGDCKKGLYCQRAGAVESGSCQEKKAASSPCSGGTLSSECKGRCDAPDGSTTGTCVSFCGSP